MNFIVLVNDSLRMDHMGCYSDVFPTMSYQGKTVATPNLDKLAAKSARFNYAFPEGLPTLQVRTASFTGRYTFPFRGWGRVEPSDVLLAEILWDKGFKSCLCTDCYHLHKPGMAYERGFDEVVFIRGHEGDPYEVDKSIEVDINDDFYKSKDRDKQMRIQAEQYLRNIKDCSGSDEDSFVAKVIKRSVRWIEEQEKKDNLFMWVDCFDPHEPWDPRGEFETMYVDPDFKGTKIKHPVPGLVEGYMTPEELEYTKGCYAGKVSQCDKWDGVLFDKLEELGMMDNTVILFYSDHGEPFGEHGIVRKALAYPYEELVRIPFILYTPDGAGAGKSYDQLLQTCDIAPTVLDALGVESKYYRMHGESVLPLISGERDKLRDHAYVGHFGKSTRINNHEWAFIDYSMMKQPNELYRYVADPGMKNNLIGQHPEKAVELELTMRRFVGKLGGPNWGSYENS